MFSNKIIFFSVLDWGFGHATRSVSIISSLEKENKIILGVTPLNRVFFESHFPKLQKIEMPSYSISYSNFFPVWVKILMQWPKINSTIKKEKKILEEIILNHRIDIVISDNRFGLNNKSIHSVFITHQLKIKVPLFSFFANYLNQKYLHRFNEIWMPDYEDKNLRLSGSLSDSSGVKIPVKYLGPKSYLSSLQTKQTNEKIDYLILLSGVEPQRSILENKLIQHFSNSTKKIVLVRGTEIVLRLKPKNMIVYDFISGAELKTIIVNSEIIFSRSGYSTLMDLHLLNKKNLILIPTPGQTEQEYLANYWRRNFSSQFFNQNEVYKIQL